MRVRGVARWKEGKEELPRLLLGLFLVVVVKLPKYNFFVALGYYLFGTFMIF